MAPCRMVSVSASVNLPLHHKAQKFSSGTGSAGWSRKKGRKTVVCVCVCVCVTDVFPEFHADVSHYKKHAPFSPPFCTPLDQGAKMLIDEI